MGLCLWNPVADHEDGSVGATGFVLCKCGLVLHVNRG